MIWLAGEPGSLPASGEEFVEALCRLFDHTTRVNRISTTARLVLFMEGSHNSSLREALSRGREALESVVVVTLARLSAHDPATAATTVAACFEGLLLHRIARHDQTDPHPAFELVVRAALD
jgi:Tetracyclin repressor-like, C-terminal domain